MNMQSAVLVDELIVKNDLLEMKSNDLSAYIIHVYCVRANCAPCAYSKLTANSGFVANESQFVVLSVIT